MNHNLLWETKLRCNHCDKLASGYTVIGYWENAMIAHCKRCNKYIMDIGGSSLGLDGETTHFEKYHDITKEQFEKWKVENIETTDVKNDIYKTTIYK